MATLPLERWIVLLYVNQTSIYLKGMASYRSRRVLVQSPSAPFLRLNFKTILYEKNVYCSGYPVKTEIL